VFLVFIDFNYFVSSKNRSNSIILDLKTLNYLFIIILNKNNIIEELRLLFNTNQRLFGFIQYSRFNSK
jgi:hypothetical protein